MKTLFCILIISLIGTFAHPSGLPDSSRDTLAKAKASYEANARLCAANLLVNLQKVVKAIAADTTLKSSDRLKASNRVLDEVKAFKEEGELPLSEKCREASMTYTAEMSKVWDTWESACGVVMEECLKAGSIELANQIESTKYGILAPCAHWEIRGINGPGHWFDYFYPNGMLARVGNHPGSWWKIEGDKVRIGELGKDADTDRRVIGTGGKSYDGRNTRNNYHYSGTRIPLNSTKSQADPTVAAKTPSTASAPQQLTILPTAALTLDPNQPLLDTFSQLAPNASAWVLAGLDEGVPPNVRQNLTYIREDLLDEYKQKPKASQEAYKLAHQLCTTMINALDERDQTLVRAGFRAVQADASISGTNQALEVRRNYMMSWPQYAREQAQRAELIRQGTAGAQVGKALPKVEWSTRTAKLRKTLDDLYAQFREALRQSAAVK